MSVKLPPGLYWCPDCGTVRGCAVAHWGDGDVFRTKSTCLCEGLECIKCGRRRLRRPISNYFDPEDGHWWHVPHFAAVGGRCSDCRGR
jgi:hypothetical protein